MPSPLETSVLGPLSRFGQKPQRAVDGAFTFLAVGVQGGGGAKEPGQQSLPQWLQVVRARLFFSTACERVDAGTRS